ncbi:unnamed protein product [Rotaria sp. Silwood1]|nr:unnamed protein product [Rotaria sp. Silwood1]
MQPRSTSGGTVARLYSNTNDQRWCVDMIGLSSMGQVIAASWNGTVQEVVGPVLPANVWTHVTSTYSRSHGIRLYVNGTLVGSTGSIVYIAPDKYNFLTLGYPFARSPCGAVSISSGSYFGDLDEFRVYSRELTAADISVLAN